MSNITYSMIESMLDHPLFKTPAPPSFKFMENINLTVPGPIETVPRSWKQRLFTLPWRPLKTHSQVQTYIPDPNYYVVLNQTIVAHPTTMVKLKKALAESEQVNYNPLNQLTRFY